MGLKAAAQPTGWQILAASALAVATPVDATEDILATITIPANAMGANGSLRISLSWSATNNANGKTIRARFSGFGGADILNQNLTSQGVLDSFARIHNRNATNSQFITSEQMVVASSIVTLRATNAVDTTAATTLVITGQKVTAGDSLVLESYLVEIYPKA